MSYFNKGNEFYNMGQYKEAIDFYKKAVASKENQAAALYNSAVCFIKLKQYMEAIPMLRDAISQKKESKYYFNLAYCYSMLNNMGLSLIYFNLAWSLDETDNDCKKAINLILSKRTKKGL